MRRCGGCLEVRVRPKEPTAGHSRESMSGYRTIRMMNIDITQTLIHEAGGDTNAEF